MTFSFSLLTRVATSSKTAAAPTQPSPRSLVQLQPQQLAQVAGGGSKVGTLVGVTTKSPRGGW